MSSLPKPIRPAAVAPGARPPGYDVFISHSSKDKAAADAACHALEARDIRCWIAPRDIRPGANWGESILEAISSVRIMVLLLSSNANASPQIQREVERAVHHGAIVIPVRIEEVMPAKSLEYFLSTSHWLDAFQPPLKAHLQHLGDTVQTILGQEVTRPPVTAAAGGGRSRRGVSYGVGAAALACAAAGGWWWHSHRAPPRTALPAVAPATTSEVASTAPAPPVPPAAPSASVTALTTPPAVAQVISPTPAASTPVAVEEANPLLKAMADMKAKSQPPPPEVRQRMKKEFVKVYANKAKYFGQTVKLDVYLFQSAEISGKLLGFICPTYPEVDPGSLTCELSKASDDVKELLLSSDGKVLTITGTVENDKALGPVIRPTGVVLVDTTAWSRP